MDDDDDDDDDDVSGKAFREMCPISERQVGTSGSSSAGAHSGAVATAAEADSSVAAASAADDSGAVAAASAADDSGAVAAEADIPGAVAAAAGEDVLDGRRRREHRMRLVLVEHDLAARREVR